MLRSAKWPMVWVLALWCAPVFAQQAQAPDSQLPDAPQQQPQTQPPPAPQPPSSDEPQKEEKKPESKVKKALKRGAPNCMHVGGVEKCWPVPGEENHDEAKGGQQQGPQQPRVPQSQPLPRSTNPDASSSKDSPVSLAPPAGEEGGAPASDVQEFHPYNPHKADKAVEVGDFYFKRNNYRASESRYAEALEYMPNHAAATYKLAEAQEKLGKTVQARANYQKYLKLLPGGEFAELAKKALARLDTQAKDTPPTSPPAQKRP